MTFFPAMTALALAAATAAAQVPLAIDPDADLLQWGPCPPIFGEGCEIAVLQGSPAEHNADLLLRVPAGFHLPPHRHTSAERMVLVNGRLQVQYQGSSPSVLTAGTYAYGPATLPHEARCLGPDNCVLFIAFEGPVDAEPFDGPIE